MPELSVIIPVFNEEKIIHPLYSLLKPSLEKLNKEYEVIFIDDGSRDDTFHAVKSVAQKDRTIRAVRFGRNYGQTAALAAGATRIRETGFALDYFEARHAETLEPIASLKDGPVRLLVAAKIGTTRLIDNIGV